MEPGDIYLGHLGNEIKLPPEGRQVQPDYVEGARIQEMPSGKLVEDIMWRKKVWKITYEIMEGEFLEQMVELYESRKFLNLIIVNRNGSIEQHEVKMILKPPIRWKAIGPWYWQSGLIELRQVRADASG